MSKKSPSKKSQPEKPRKSGGAAPTLKEPGTSPDATEHLILSFKSVSDPSPAQMAEARAAVLKSTASAIVRERPGMFRIRVASRDKEKTHDLLAALNEWEVSEEGQASMPIRDMES